MCFSANVRDDAVGQRTCSATCVPWRPRGRNSIHRGSGLPEAVVAGRPRGVRVVDLRGGSGDVVPPHRDRGFEGFAAEQNEAGSRVRVDRDLVSAGLEVGELARCDGSAGHGNGALEHDDGVFVALANRNRAGTEVERQFGAEVLGVAAGIDRDARKRSDKDTGGPGGDVSVGEFRVVFEGGWIATRSFGLSDPELDAVQAAVELGGFLGVRDATTGGHEIELSGTDQLFGSETVAMEEFAGYDPCDGLETDVRMGTDSARTLIRCGWPDVVGEAPRADGATVSLWECASNVLSSHGRGSALHDFDRVRSVSHR